MNKSNIKNIIIIVSIVAGLFFLYTFFVKGNNDDDLLVSSSSTQSPVIEELFSILNKLSQLRINESIFQDASYKSLEDYTVIVNPEPYGRINPFELIE